MLKCQKVKTANIIHLKGCRFGQKEQLFGCFFLGTKKKDLLISGNKKKIKNKKKYEELLKFVKYFQSTYSLNVGYTFYLCELCY